MSDERPAVFCRDITYRYREDLPLTLQGIQLEVRKGEAFGLVGPDGAGKTTLMRCICGLLEPTSGNLQVFGDTLPEAINRVKPRLGYVSQRFSLYGDLTIRENLDFFADIHGVRGKAAEEKKRSLLEFTRLAPFHARLADRLSGGMKQKLSLICTLIHEPELLLLDEPTTGVDPITRRDFWTILNTLNQQGLTTLMSTPYLDEAERCTRVALVAGGRILAVGAPNDLRRSSGLTVLEVVCSPVREAASCLTGYPGIRAVHSFGDRLHLLLEDAGTGSGADTLLASVTAHLRQSDIVVRDARGVVPSLEDVFIYLVEQAEGKTEGHP